MTAFISKYCALRWELKISIWNWTWGSCIYIILFLGESDYDNDQTNYTYDFYSFKPINLEQPFNINDEMNKAYQRNESRIMNQSIRLIANGIYSHFNSLNILVGQQGKGKIHIMLRNVIQMSRMKNSNFHLIVNVSRNGSINDATFESQRELIQLPIKVISDSNAEEYLKQLDFYKQLYSNTHQHQKYQSMKRSLMRCSTFFLQRKYFGFVFCFSTRYRIYLAQNREITLLEPLWFINHFNESMNTSIHSITSSVTRTRSPSSKTNLSN